MKCTAKLVALSLSEGLYPKILHTVTRWTVELPSYQTTGGNEGFYVWPLLELKGWARGSLNAGPAFLGEEFPGVELVFENDVESLSYMFLRSDFISFIDRLERDGRLMGHNWDLDEMANYVSEAAEAPKPVCYMYGPEHLSD